MEIVLFVCMMVVPFVSIAALLLAWIDHKRVEALRRIFIETISRSDLSPSEKLEAMEI